MYCPGTTAPDCMPSGTVGISTACTTGRAVPQRVETNVSARKRAVGRMEDLFYDRLQLRSICRRKNGGILRERSMERKLYSAPRVL